MFTTLTVVVAVFFVGLDLRSAEFRAGFSSDRPRLWRNVGYLLSNVVTMIALGLVNAWLARTITALWSWQALPRVVEVGACVVVAEGINWCSHWVKHQQPWLWTFHLQHHVGRHYDTTLTLHTHGVDVVVSGALMSAVLLWCGFTKLSVDVFVLLYFATNLYKHGHSRLSLGPVLDRIIVGPAYHRVHHMPHTRGNYGSVLTLFDVVLQTAIWPSSTSSSSPVYDEAVGVDGTAPQPCVDELLLPVSVLRSSRHTR
ncbi:MAG TPA: sterol desaturase family protein [Myxococcota bacterium]